MDLKERIIAYMRNEAYKPLTEEDLGEAMGLTDEQCNRSIRLSVDDGITTEEADTLINEINRIRKELAILSEFN